MHDGDGEDRRALRYLEWTWDPDPADSTYVVDFVLLLRDAAGQVRVEADHHEFGLFGTDDWLRLVAEVGFEPRLVLSDNGALFEYGGGAMFVGRKPQHTHEGT